MPGSLSAQHLQPLWTKDFSGVLLLKSSWYLVANSTSGTSSGSRFTFGTLTGQDRRLLPYRSGAGEVGSTRKDFQYELGAKSEWLGLRQPSLEIHHDTFLLWSDFRPRDNISYNSIIMLPSFPANPSPSPKTNCLYCWVWRRRRERCL